MDGLRAGEHGGNIIEVALILTVSVKISLLVYSIVFVIIGAISRCNGVDSISGPLAYNVNVHCHCSYADPLVYLILYPEKLLKA